ncbi:MAG: phosphate signaling complex protein PhoU [Alphaproteobacteria bacterium]|nr:phosphate signaling complex protein PhoU [Alphaproteobacteria bacterium]
MSNHTVSTYDQELNKLRGSIVQMAKLVLEIIEMSRQSIERTFINFTDKTAELDKEINQLDVIIEKHATSLLALRQPMAIDLRLITISLKLATILERMGDIAKNIAKRANRISEKEKDISLFSNEVITYFDKIAVVVENMISEVILAFEHLDQEAAVAVWKRDDDVDAHYHQLFLAIQKEMISDPRKIEQAVQVMFAAKNFERLGDYAANFAKAVYYIASGKRLRISEIEAQSSL